MPENSTYLLVRDSDGLCVNAIAWDGVEPYEEAGHSLIEWDAEVRPWIGWTLTDGEWTAPPPEEEVPAE